MADAGGVEFHMELSAKLDEAAKLVREMSKVEAEAAKLDKALRNAGKSTTLLADITGKAGGSFKAVGGDMLGHLTALATFEGLKRLGEGFFDLGKEALQAAGEAERTRRSFEILLGDEPADQLLGFMDRLAEKTEFTDGALKGFAGALVKAGISGERLERAMAATIDLAAMTPDKMAGAANAVGLISKIQLKGGISERELVGAGISGEKFFKRVAEETGIGIKDVEKKIGEGKVKANVLIEALYSQIAEKTGKPLGGAGIAMSQTFLAQLEKTKDIVPNLFEELEKSGGFTEVTKGLNRLVTGLSPDSPAGGRIIRGLEGMIDHFGKLVSEIDFDAWSKRLVTAIEIFTVLVDVGAKVGGELGMLFGKFTAFGEALGESLYETTQLVGDFFNAAYEIGTAVWEGLQNGIVKGITFVVDAVEGMGTAVADKLKAVLGIHSPSSVFADFGMMTSRGFELGIERALPSVADTVAAAFGPRMLLPAIGGAAAGREMAGPALAGVAAGPGAQPVLAGAFLGAYEPPPARGGGPRIEASITINIGAPAGNEAAAREQADEVAFSVRRAIESLYEEWAAEGGAV